MLDNNRIVGNGNNTNFVEQFLYIGIYYWRVRYFMLLFGQDIVVQILSFYE